MRASHARRPSRIALALLPAFTMLCGLAGTLAGTARADCGSVCLSGRSEVIVAALLSPSPAVRSTVAGSSVAPSLKVIGSGPTSVVVTQIGQAEARAKVPARFTAIASGFESGFSAPKGYGYGYVVYNAEEYASSGLGAKVLAAGELHSPESPANPEPLCGYDEACELALPEKVPGEPGKYTLESPGHYVVLFTAISEGNPNYGGVTEGIEVPITAQPALSSATIEAVQNSNAPPGEVIAGSLQTFNATVQGGVGPYTYHWESVSGNKILEPSTGSTVTELFADELNPAEHDLLKVFNTENEKYGLKPEVRDEATSLTIQDADGATVSATPVSLGKVVADELRPTITPPSATIYATVGTTFSASATGGVSPYTYEWSISKEPAPAPAISFKHVASGQSATFAFPESSSVQKYIVSAEITDSAQPYKQADAQSLEVTVQPTPHIEEKTTVSCPGGGAPETVTFPLPAITQAVGCFTKGSSGGATTYTSSGTVKINGIPITPNAAIGSLLLTAPTASHPGGTISVPDAAAALQLPNGEIAQIVQGKLAFDLPTLPEGQKSGQAKVVSLGSAKGVKLFGFQIAGGVTLNFDLSSGGEYSSSVDLNLALPSVFKNGPPDGSNPPGGLSGEVQIKVTGSAPVFEGVHFEVENAYIGDLVVNELCFSLIPGGSGYAASCAPKDTSFTSPSNEVISGCGTTNLNPNVDTWTADAKITLPKPLTASIGMYGGGETASDGETKIDYFGGEGSKLDVPLFEGVDLESVGVGVCFSPLKISGKVGVGMMPVDGQDTVGLAGQLTYTAGTAYVPAKGATPAVPATPWKLNFKGEVEVLKQEVGNGEVGVEQDGDFNFGVNLKLGLGKYVTLEGAVAGWVQPQYKLFNIDGHILVAIDIAGVKASAYAEGVVSSTGAAGCIGVSVVGQSISAGAGAKWGQPANVMFGSCSIGGYEAAKQASVAAAGGAHILTLPGGLRGIALRIAGTTGPPQVSITGPGGKRIVSPQSAPLVLKKSHYLLMEDPAHNATDVLLVAPKAGRYRITSLTPGDTIASVGTGRVLPSFSGHGKVSGHGAHRTLHLRYTLPQGSRLAIVERGSHVVHTIVKAAHGRPCRSGHGRRMLCLTVHFTPTQGAGGVRKIEADVQREGLPLPPVVVARYRAPALRLPSRPRKVQLQRSRSTVTVRWSPSRGAAQYSVFTATSLGAQHLFTLPAKCRGVRLLGIPHGAGLKARVEGVRFDGIAGPARIGKLAAPRATKPKHKKGHAKKGHHKKAHHRKRHHKAKQSRAGKGKPHHRSAAGRGHPLGGPICAAG